MIQNRMFLKLVSIIAEWKRPASVSDRRDNARHPDHQDRPASLGKKINPQQRRQAKDDPHPQQHLPRLQQSCLRDAQRTQPCLRVSAAIVIEDIVRQISSDLQQQSRQQAGQRRT